MWRLAVALGVLLWLLTIAASAAMNAFVGYSFGRTPTEGYIFAALGVAADGWKALAPVCFVSLARARRVFVSAVAVLLWIACFTYAVSSAIGLAAQNRLATTGGREAIVNSYASVSAEIAGLKGKRARIQTLRVSSELEAAIAAALAEPIGSHGTVDSLSNGCLKQTTATRVACAAVAGLRIELASAHEAKRLDDLIDGLARETTALTTQGGRGETDPQARVIAAILHGLVSVKQVGLGLMLLLVIMVELVSAFGPLVLTEFVRVEARERGVRSNSADVQNRSTGALVPIGDVLEFMAEKIRPAPDGHATIAALQESYERWCTQHCFAPLPSHTFLHELERICRDELKGKVRRRRSRFEGLTLAAPLLLLKTEH